MANLLRSYLGLDKEPEPEPKPDPRLERTSKFVRPKKKNQKKPKSFDPVKKVENDDEN